MTVHGLRLAWKRDGEDLAGSHPTCCVEECDQRGCAVKASQP